MSVIVANQENRMRENFDAYILKYGHLYPTKALEYIKKKFKEESFDSDIIPDIMHQVYSAIGAYDNVDNFYDKCIEEMLKSFDLEGSLLDVGCGYYPAVAKRIRRMQKRGSVSAIDYDVLTTDFKDIEVYKEKFMESTDIGGYTLIYGIMPCEATIPIIKNACRNDKDMFIQLCGCTHFDNSLGYRYGYANLGIWYDYLESLIGDLISADRVYQFYIPSWGEYPVIKSLKK